MVDSSTNAGWVLHAYYKVKLTFPYLWYDTDRCLLVFLYITFHTTEMMMNVEVIVSGIMQRPGVAEVVTPSRLVCSDKTNVAMNTVRVSIIPIR